MAYPRAAPPAIVAAAPNLLGLPGIDEDEGRGGFWGTVVSSMKAPGMEELDGRAGLEEGVFTKAPGIEELDGRWGLEEVFTLGP
jgi:hypothetical protein